MSLSRLWQLQGKRGEAHRLLVDVYSWFTEGFETPTYRTRKRCSRHERESESTSNPVGLASADMSWTGRGLRGGSSVL